jgi:hypothetical protein
VRDGKTVAALIIPPTCPTCSQAPTSRPTSQVIYNGDAINQSLVESAIESKLAQANALLAAQLEKVADSYIDLLLSGGRLNFLGLASTSSACATRRRSSTECSAPAARLALRAKLAREARLRKDRRRRTSPAQSR